ncbi:MAG: LEA type 2 family protein [Woeseiaceae bacterium]|nr:LEA type 2 family protein [Woeseiaceae bacterium]
MNRKLRAAAAALVLINFSGCAGMTTLVSAPTVNLDHVEVTELGFSGQTFLLAFDVANPNPFPLPVNSIAYGVELDGQRFATGTATGGFTVPASGTAEFAISVELDLLKTAPPLLYTVKDSMTRAIPYELKGEFDLDIPATEPLRFRSSGAVRFSEVGRHALQMP